MAAPVVNPLPAAPQRGSGASDFNAVTDAFLAALPTFRLQMNALASYVSQYGSSLDSIKNSADSALTSINQYRSNAQLSASSASASLATAQTYAALAGSALGVPSAAGQSGKSLMVNSSGALVWGSEIEIGDVIFSAVNPGPYFPANGAIRSIASAATLAAKMGSLGGTPALAWNTITTGVAGTPADISSNTTSGVVIILFTNGAAARSTDRGVTWSALTINAAFTSGAALSCDDNGVWVAVAGNTGTAYRSSDDGLTWTAVSTLVGTAMGRVANNRAGVWIATYAAANTAVMRSTDNGLTWASVTTGTSAVHGQPATDGQGVWCVGAASTIRRSYDEGLTWIVQFSAASTQSCLATDKHGIWLASGASGSTNTYKSVDNGLTWTLLPMPTTAATLDITYALGFFIICRTSLGVVTLSAAPDATVYTTQASLSGANRITHAGNGLLLETTASAAPNLSRSLPSYGYDTATQFRVPDVPSVQGIPAWVKAGNRLSYQPYNFQQSATLVYTGTSELVGASDGKDTYVLGTATSGVTPQILRSTDGGRTWSAVTTQASGPILSITCNRAGIWLASTQTGQILRSVDNGASWTVAATLNSGNRVQGVLMGIGGDVAIARSVDNAYRSTDKGLTWTLITSLNNSALMATDSVGTWIALRGTSSPGQIFRSTDDGETWTLITIAGGYTLTGVEAGMPGTFLIATSTTTLLRSTDGGATWATQAIPAATPNLFSSGRPGVFVRLSTTTTAYVSVDDGVTWSTTTLPLTSMRFIAGDTNPWMAYQGTGKAVYKAQSNPTMVA